MNTNNILLGILIVLVFAVGFMIGRFSSTEDSPIPIFSAEKSVLPEKNETSNRASTNEEMKGGEVEGGLETTNNNEATTIKASAMTEGQRKMLSALGIDADAIFVTPEMMACAKSEIGDSRMNEIINGDTPTFGEGIKLVACYK